MSRIIAKQARISSDAIFSKDLTAGDVRLLGLLSTYAHHKKHPGYCFHTYREIALDLGMDSSTVKEISERVSRLRKHGFVETKKIDDNGVQLHLIRIFFPQEEREDTA